MIGLAELAESYVKEQQRDQQQRSTNGSVNTKTNLENRASKQKRIQEALEG